MKGKIYSPYSTKTLRRWEDDKLFAKLRQLLDIYENHLYPKHRVIKKSGRCLKVIHPNEMAKGIELNMALIADEILRRKVKIPYDLKDFFVGYTGKEID